MIGEPLADDATKHCIGAIGIAAAERGAVAVAEIELNKIAVMQDRLKAFADALDTTRE